jgi:transposase InsO family protein
MGWSAAFRIADNPPGTRTNGSSMSALPWYRQLTMDLGIAASYSAVGVYWMVMSE